MACEPLRSAYKPRDTAAIAPTRAQGRASSAAGSSMGACRERKRMARRLRAACIQGDIGAASAMVPPLPPIATELSRLHRLSPQANLRAGIQAVLMFLDGLEQRPPAGRSGAMRIEVELPLAADGTDPLAWLRQLPADDALWPRVHFSPRSSSGLAGGGAVSGVGAARLWHGRSCERLGRGIIRDMQRFLEPSGARVFGGARFDPDAAPAPEWAPFGSALFFIPTLELAADGKCLRLACTVAWDAIPGDVAEGHASFHAAAAAAKATCMAAARGPDVAARAAPRALERMHAVDGAEWTAAVDALQPQLASNAPIREDLLSGATRQLSPTPPLPTLVKVVLARATTLSLSSPADPWLILEELRAADPTPYLYGLQLPGRAAFIAATPERLYERRGSAVISEAVAGTRPRSAGDEAVDARLALELLLSPKEHREFAVVRDAILESLAPLCSGVEPDVGKAVLKQATVQHLYSRISGTLRPGVDDADIMAALHPTPAVCGQPRGEALAAIASRESFDRGWYAGPVGWLSADGAEFAVAIRSALFPPAPRAVLYAGVGIVAGADGEAEWRELDLKTRQFDAVFAALPALVDMPNVNALWARLIVEELCRCGVTTFCIAPGSRSSPLALAAAGHPRARCVVALDERSLAFYALGYSRATGRPAAVVTSSGTAVGNLLPAAMEASEDAIPLVLITADRPPELLDGGANQTADQTKIFGSYVRWSASLPAPDGVVPARVALTTIDAAVFRACGAHPGPVHVNCCFREPLAPTAVSWSPAVLVGLTRWEAGRSPFTSYIAAKATNLDLGNLAGLLAAAPRVLLVAGGLSNPADAFAVSQLSCVFGWPIIADPASGLRVQASGACVANQMDQLLLVDDGLHARLRPQAILQFGGRLTSKRVSAFLEQTVRTGDDADADITWAFVDRHPRRHDPAHLLTHRLQIAPAEFVSLLLSALPVDRPQRNSQMEYGNFLEALSAAVGRELHSSLQELDPLTEPHVAHAVASHLPIGHGCFMGNSMPVRDIDFYTASTSEDHHLASFGAAIAANRGVSGIDGVTSTAAGFAAGLGRPVTLLIGDVSFCHDTNGLFFLRTKPRQPPLTVVLVNNSGGGIFKFLPVAGAVQPETFTTFFSTPPSVDFGDLCRAHSVPYLRVSSKDAFDRALAEAWQQTQRHTVIEAVVEREANVPNHRFLEARARCAARRALSWPGVSIAIPLHGVDTDYRHYSLPLAAGLSSGGKANCRRGMLLTLRGQHSSSCGDICPLPGLHAETIELAEGQLRLLCSRLRECTSLPRSLALLDGSFANWIQHTLGLLPEVLLPSVRCGLEEAVIGFLANEAGVSPASLMAGSDAAIESRYLPVNGLLQHEGGCIAVAADAVRLVSQGYQTLKLKVGRRSVDQDVEVLRAVRDAVGPSVAIRCDANRAWTLDQAVSFGKAAHALKLEYIEEPVQNPRDIPEFYERTGLRVALDESVDEELIGAEKIPLGRNQGVYALVIKPSRVGGFERTVQLARWARCRKQSVVISSAFESSIGLAACAQLAAYLDSPQFHPPGYPDAKLDHGLGTQDRFLTDVVQPDFVTSAKRYGETAAISLVSSAQLLANAEARVGESPVVSKPAAGYCRFERTEEVETSAGIYSFRVVEWLNDAVGCSSNMPILFLHGFLGDADDWSSIAESLSVLHRCVAVDLPGHGPVNLNSMKPDGPLTMEAVGDAIGRLAIQIGFSKCCLVGYSLGARLALLLAVRKSSLFPSAVIISGSAGLEGEPARFQRRTRDAALAAKLRMGGLTAFLEDWYEQPLFKGLASSPQYAKMLARRLVNGDVDALASVLTGLSSGAQPWMLPELRSAASRITYIAGCHDLKFVDIAKQLSEATGYHAMPAVIVPSSSHACHIERAEVIADSIAKFLK